jgi:hypothetical protein
MSTGIFVYRYHNEEDFGNNVRIVKDKVRTFVKGGTLRIRKIDGSNGPIACSLQDKKSYNFCDYEDKNQAKGNGSSKEATAF